MPKRRRGARSAFASRRRADERFERLVERALDGIPPPFSTALDEVAIVIEDDAIRGAARHRRAGPRRRPLRAVRGDAADGMGSRSVPFPNKISLFRIPLEEDFPDPDDLAEEVRVTVIHELAHHLGIDDDRLEELGLE